jgi:hypothetical protein
MLDQSSMTLSGAELAWAQLGDGATASGGSGSRRGAISRAAAAP